MREASVMMGLVKPVGNELLITTSLLETFAPVMREIMPLSVTVATPMVAFSTATMPMLRAVAPVKVPTSRTRVAPYIKTAPYSKYIAD